VVKTASYLIVWARTNDGEAADAAPDRASAATTAALRIARQL